jgi:pimeloyl-ACP methyl ester carboxylesterase
MPLPARLSVAAVILYLHGFASSAKSTKAGYFAERLRAHGRTLIAPDFNEPDFRSLTMTRMLGEVERTIDAAGAGQATLIGSSLGGTLAVLAAAKMPTRVDRLVLLAPAVMFAKPGHHLLPPERIAEWRRKGSLSFFHYAHNEERPLDVAFYDDSLTHDAFGASFPQPTLVFQGVHDAAVPCQTVQSFASARPNVSLTLLDDDHQLIVSLPRIWSEMEPFLGLRR